MAKGYGKSSSGKGGNTEPNMERGKSTGKVKTTSSLPDNGTSKTQGQEPTKIGKHGYS